MDLMEKSQRADFLFEVDHEEAAALPGRHAEEDNNDSSMLCFGSCSSTPPPTRDSSRRRPPEAKAPRTSLASFTKAHGQGPPSRPLPGGPWWRHVCNGNYEASPV